MMTRQQTVSIVLVLRRKTQRNGKLFSRGLFIGIRWFGWLSAIKSDWSQQLYVVHRTDKRLFPLSLKTTKTQTLMIIFFKSLPFPSIYYSFAIIFHSVL